MSKSQYDELRRLIRECCDEAMKAGKLAVSSAKRVDSLQRSIEHFRGRLATLELWVRGTAEAASKIPPRGNPEK